MELDHLVINTLRGMEDAARIFTALGFALTPRGYHSLGSVNHLAVVPGAYLELVGLPETGKQRQEVLDSPLGLSGLVFKTDDPDALFARLTAQGLAVAEPIAFSRPVELADETRHARFRTVRLAPSVFPAGRVYFCQHFTPELVWRPEDMTHPNGFRAMSRQRSGERAARRQPRQTAPAARIEGTPPSAARATRVSIFAMISSESSGGSSGRVVEGAPLERFAGGEGRERRVDAERGVDPDAPSSRHRSRVGSTALALAPALCRPSFSIEDRPRDAK